MTFRDILVHVSPDERGRLRATQAVDLAEKLGACLTGAHIRPPAEVGPHFKPSQVELATAALSDQLARDIDAARAIFSDVIRGRPVETCWYQADDDFAAGIAAAARCADLVILGQDEGQDPPEKHPLPVAHSVVLQCGRPVLVVPAQPNGLVPSKAAIGWDGSREAVRAVHDALPLLKLAREVDIVTVSRSSDLAEAAQTQRLITHLSRHGISARALIEHVARVDEHRRLKLDTDHGYDLIVMGGYSHPRWLEFMIGGMTISTMLMSRTPVLLSH